MIYGMPLESRKDWNEREAGRRASEPMGTTVWPETSAPWPRAVHEEHSRHQTGVLGIKIHLRGWSTSSDGELPPSVLLHPTPHSILPW